MDDDFGWARRALSSPKRWFLARADVWKVQYAAPNVTDILDIDLHVAHDRLGELRALRGVTVTGVMIEDVTATLKEQVNRKINRKLQANSFISNSMHISQTAQTQTQPQRKQASKRTGVWDREASKVAAAANDHLPVPLYTPFATLRAKQTDGL